MLLCVMQFLRTSLCMSLPAIRNVPFRLYWLHKYSALLQTITMCFSLGSRLTDCQGIFFQATVAYPKAI